MLVLQQLLSGIEIDRGTADNVSLVYDDNEDEWRFLQGSV